MFGEFGTFRWWTQLQNTNAKYFERALMDDIQFGWRKLKPEILKLPSAFSVTWSTGKILTASLDVTHNGQDSLYVRIGRNIPVTALMPARLLNRDEWFIAKESQPGQFLIVGNSFIHMPWSKQEERAVLNGKELTEWLGRWLTQRWGATVESNILPSEMVEIEGHLLRKPGQIPPTGGKTKGELEEVGNTKPVAMLVTTDDPAHSSRPGRPSNACNMWAKEQFEQGRKVRDILQEYSKRYNKEKPDNSTPPQKELQRIHREWREKKKKARNG